jgi:hypothetical protein
MNRMTSDSPKIMGLVVNIMDTTRIESIAVRLGFQVFWVESLFYWAKPRVDELIKIDPVLIIIDLGIIDIQWEECISDLKTNQKTSHIPLLCFGSHVNVDLLRSVKKAGADRVVARSKFFSSMGRLVEKHAIQP